MTFSFSSRERDFLVPFCHIFITLFTHCYLQICSFLTPGLRRLFWSVALVLALACSAFFVFSNTNDFMRATIVTSLDTQNVPLSEVFFPSVVVCNLNQVILTWAEAIFMIFVNKVRQSLFVELGVDGNRTLSREVYHQLVHGKNSSMEVKC